MHHRFSLLTALLVIAAIAIVLTLSFRLPVNAFAFDRQTGDQFRPLTTEELMVRFLTFGILSATVLAGILLAARELLGGPNRR
jgi:hypothetical protein